MNLSKWQGIGWLKQLLATRQPEPERQAERIVAMQLHIVLPAKAGVIVVALYYVFFSGWMREVPAPHLVAFQFLKGFFGVYVLCNFAGVGMLMLWRRFPPGFFQWLVFVLGLLDGLFMSGLVFITGGFDSIAYYLFPGVIVINALSIPLASPQLALNILLSVFYLSACLMETSLPAGMLQNTSTAATKTTRATNGSAARFETNSPNTTVPVGVPLKPKRRPVELPYDPTPQERSTEPVVMRMIVLWLLTVCCYGVQVLSERQRRMIEEARESAVRDAQLHSAGRLAAEFAHQIKNPLAIINNAAFSIHRALKAGRTDIFRQIEIIQEEVEHSDRIVTQIMGYAQLNEGRVEKLDVVEELDRAIEQVFPRGVKSGIRVERDYAPTFPPLLMQRRHLSDSLVNLLQNAREALAGKGRISVSAVCRRDYSVEIVIADNGPGIAPDKLSRVFEAYYSTKEKGSGLGLSIVKHNVELYTGTVRIESELGKGARFILTFPAKTVISLTK